MAVMVAAITEHGKVPVEMRRMSSIEQPRALVVDRIVRVLQDSWPQSSGGRGPVASGWKMKSSWAQSCSDSSIAFLMAKEGRS